MFFVIFQHIDLKFHTWIFLDILQVKCKFCCGWPTFNWVIALCKNLVFQTFFSCLVILTWHFGIWICLDIIQIKVDFYFVWPDCTPDIFFCLNLVFRTFLCRLARYWHQIWGMNWYWHNTENFTLLYPFMYYFWSYASSNFVGAGRGHVLLQQQYLQYACFIRIGLIQ